MPAFTGWLCFSLGIVLAHIFSRLYNIPIYNDVFLYAIVILLISALVIRSLKVRALLFVVCGFLLFSFNSQKEDSFFKELNSVVNIDGDETIEGKVISVPLLSRRKYNFLVAADMLYSNIDTIKMHGRALKCTGRISPPSFGKVTLKGRYRAPKRPANPYTFNEYSYLLSNRIWGRFDVGSFQEISNTKSFASQVALSTRATVLRTISHVKDVNIQGILQAAFLGEKNNLTSHIKNLFREAGIYHLLAISGLHVAILISSMLVILMLFPIPKVIKIVVTILFIWCYLFFIGFIPSLFRAVVMATIILASFMFQRNNYTINSLGVAGLIWLIMSPGSLFTPGYQLSFAATFGIITLFPLFTEKLIPHLNNDVLHLIEKTILSFFFVSLAGFIATVPVLAYHFGRISLFGLAANIFSVFLMAFAMNSFFIGIITQLIWEPISIIVMRFSEFCLSLIVGIADFSRFVSWASIEVPVPYAEFFLIYFFMFLGLAMINKKYFFKYFAWVFPIIFLASPLIISCHNLNSYTEVTIFSTKEGPLTGIRFPNRKIWLAGSISEGSFDRSYKNVIGPRLRHYMIKKVDAVLIPHAGPNVIHDLDPILADNKPAFVITGNKPKGRIPEENFDSFMRSYNVSHIEAKNGRQFIPAEQCTCTIYKHENTGKWYEKSEAVIINFSFSNTQLLINGTNKTLSGMNSENAVIRINKDIALYTDHKQNFLQQNKGRNSGLSLSTEEEGAVIIRIKRSGAISIRHML